MTSGKFKIQNVPFSFPRLIPAQPIIEVRGDIDELFKRSLEVFHEFLGANLGIDKVVGFF